MKIETKTTHHVNYNDLDDAINEFLKKKGCSKTFEFVDHEEMMNDSSKEFNIGSYDWAVPDEEKKKEIIGGKLSWRTNWILEWMHEEDEIPSGNYVDKSFLVKELA